MQNFGAWQVQFKYIATDPHVLGGKPIIKGTRISVEFILELVASGASVKDIVAAYPDLPEEAVKEAIEYAAAQLRHDAVIDISTPAA
ncbi:MAG: DUF433 domain-containing protein [Haliscomenobacter sp.]|nr:DUF433 domain-containing protein [Haliscomenobacter sp.]